MPHYGVRRPYGGATVREVQAALGRMLGRDPTSDELVDAMDRVEAQPSASGRAQTWKNYRALILNAVGANAPVAATTANVRPSTAYNQASRPAPVLVQNDPETFAISKLSYIATDPRLYVKLYDDYFSAHWSRNALNLMEVAGYMGAGSGTPPLPIFGTTLQSISFQPGVLDEEWILAGRASLSADFADYSAAANPVRLVFHGGHILPGPAPWDDFQGRKIPDWVSLPPDDVSPVIAAANGILQTSARLDDQGDFVVTKITAMRTAAVSVQITDAYGRDWFIGGPIHIDNLCGSGQFPNRLPGKRLMPSNYPVSVTLTDLSGVANTFARLTLHGYRLVGRRTTL